jgi:hypothetical protein
MRPAGTSSSFFFAVHLGGSNNFFNQSNSVKQKIGQSRAIALIGKEERTEDPVNHETELTRPNVRMSAKSRVYG